MKNLPKGLFAVGGPLLALLLVIAIWAAAVRLWDIPPYVLPSPALTWAHILADLPMLLDGFRQTFLTFLLGFALGAGAGFSFAVVMDAVP